MSNVSELQCPVRRAVAAAQVALAGDPGLVSADGERGLAGLLWQAGDDELDAVLGQVRAVEATAAALRLALVREARRRGLQHRTGAPDIAAWPGDRYGVDRPAARAEADLAVVSGPGGVGELTGVALAAGVIGEARARLVLTCLDRLPTGLADAVVAEAQRRLLAVAEYGRAADVRPAGRKLVEQLTDRSTDGPAPTEPVLRNEVRLRPAGVDGWWRLSGMLDEEHAALIRAATEALIAPGRTPAPSPVPAGPPGPVCSQAAAGRRTTAPAQTTESAEAVRGHRAASTAGQRDRDEHDRDRYGPGVSPPGDLGPAHDAVTESDGVPSDGSRREPGGAPDEEIRHQPPADPKPDPGLFGADPTDPVLVPLPERRPSARYRHRAAGR